MSDRTCSVDGCSKPFKVVGPPTLCQMHYVRLRRTGSLELDRPTDIERLMARVVIDPATGCWNYTGQRTVGGYGLFSYGGRNGTNTTSHRFSYEHHVGPVPDGLVMDHLCRNRACCNPEHLEPVTQRENYHRGETNANVTRCKHGHEFSTENTYVDRDGSRHCITCRRARDKGRKSGWQRQRDARKTD